MSKSCRCLKYVDIRWQSRWLAYCAIGISATIFPLAHIRAQEEDLKNRVINEAPRAWAKFAARAKSIQGSAVRRVIALHPARKVVDEIRYEFKQRDTNLLWLRQETKLGENTATRGELAAVNDRYGFELRRTNIDAPWAVKDVKGIKDFNPFENPVEAIPMWTTFAIRLDHADETLLPYLFQHPNFSIKKVSSVTENSMNLARIDFSFKYDELSRKKPWGVKAGWIILDPEMLWVLRKYEVTQVFWGGDHRPPSEDIWSGISEYKSDSGELPLLVRKVRKLMHSEKAVEREYTFELREENASPREFTLPAFGFLEPAEFQRSARTYWYVAFAVSGFAAIALGFYLKRRSFRTSQ